MTIQKLQLVVCVFLISNTLDAQILPDQDYPILFNDIQVSGIFDDGKTFPDCIPLITATKVDSLYLNEKLRPGFNLEDFVNTYFIKPKRMFEFTSDTTISIDEHIEYLWDFLTRTNSSSSGSLIGLPNPYVIPGGRFREVYYWDTYFTMLGLAQSGKTDLIENMLNNFAFLVDTFGFIPNGNRTYYLSRSQPPFFSLMIDLLASLKGEEIYIKYLFQLESEYNFWMNGIDLLNENTIAFRRVVLLPNGAVLNRYWDDNPKPRPEAYAEDLRIAQLSPEPDSIDFRNIRAACESGWDFSSRWFKDSHNLATIETTNIIPVDLNSLLYHTEVVLSKSYLIAGEKNKSKYYHKLAKARKKAINKYFWSKNDGFFTDYNWLLDKQKLPIHTAGLYPLFFNIATNGQAKEVAECIQHKFISEGGVVTSFLHTEQQWDAPNGWAPIQHIAVQALLNYEMDNLAKSISERWLLLNKKVYLKEGKLLEKYNVEDVNLKGGGGEYPTQDGFGWTNGVYLHLKSIDFNN